MQPVCDGRATCFIDGRKMLSLKAMHASLLVSGANASGCSFMTNVGNLSIDDDLGGMELMRSMVVGGLMIVAVILSRAIYQHR